MKMPVRMNRGSGVRRVITRRLREDRSPFGERSNERRFRAVDVWWHPIIVARVHRSSAIERLRIRRDRMSPQMTLTAGTKLGPYEITGTLGAGGMGEVYRARDGRLNRDVAIKVLPQSVAHDRDRIARFEQEAKTTAALNHPNIVALYDVGSDGGLTFVVSELLTGGTLRERMQSGGLTVRKIIDLAHGIVNGLAAAHARGIVHRDLKPENIFVTADSSVKIL